MTRSSIVRASVRSRQAQYLCHTRSTSIGRHSQCDQNHAISSLRRSVRSGSEDMGRQSHLRHFSSPAAGCRVEEEATLRRRPEKSSKRKLPPIVGAKNSVDPPRLTIRFGELILEQFVPRIYC